MATPLLSLLGFPGFVAVASPLPATVPSTVVTSAEYWRSDRDGLCLFSKRLERVVSFGHK